MRRFVPAAGMVLLYANDAFVRESLASPRTHTFLASLSALIRLLASPPASTPSPDASLGFIGTILGAVLAALIAGFFGIRYVRYTAQKTRELEQEKQKNEELQRRLDVRLG